MYIALQNSLDLLWLRWWEYLCKTSLSIISHMKPSLLSPVGVGQFHTNFLYLQVPISILTFSAYM